MNEILTAKEWLEKEGSFPKELNREQVVAKMVWQEIMERYADYRTKMLEDKFSKYRKEAEMRILELEGKLQFLKNSVKTESKIN